MSRILLFLLVVLLSGSSFGQQKTLLYSIRKKDMPTSYLYGTVHLIADSAYSFPSKLEKTFLKADKLVLEINSLSDIAQAEKLMKLDSGNMFNIFPLDQVDSVVIWGSQMLNMKPDVFIQGFAGMKPFMLVQVATQAMMKGTPTKSCEWELIAKANAHKMPILGLETMAYQIGLFDNMPDSVMAEMIMEGIRHPEEAIRNQRELTRLYMEKDVEGLAQLIAESGDMAGNVETLVYQRNRNWIPIMENYMQTNSCFFAVGAGHLGGENGVIQLLQHAGYTVTPIFY